LAYTWRYKGYPGSSQVIFELFASGNQTQLKVMHMGVDSFAANGPDFARESFGAGWTYILGTSLKQFVEK
jgi:hypothetical protein